MLVSHSHPPSAPVPMTTTVICGHSRIVIRDNRIINSCLIIVRNDVDSANKKIDDNITLIVLCTLRVIYFTTMTMTSSDIAAKRMCQKFRQFLVISVRPHNWEQTPPQAIKASDNVD